MKYRKKAVVIDAVQWHGGNLPECMHFLGESFMGQRQERRPGGANVIMIKTLEGQHIASLNDFLIRGVKGEHYPCKPDIFAATYESAEINLYAADFSGALMWLKEGKRVQRAGWNGKGMWLKLVPTDIADKVAFEYAALDAAPWIGMKTADDKFVPWLASQTDMLATDWQVVK